MLRTHVKRFKAEKVKNIECDDIIANAAAFIKGLLTDHPMFGELIMRKNLTLVNSYALAEKHSFWDKAKRAKKVFKQPRKDSKLRRGRTRSSPTPKTITTRP